MKREANISINEDLTIALQEGFNGFNRESIGTQYIIVKLDGWSLGNGQTLHLGFEKGDTTISPFFVGFDYESNSYKLKVPDEVMSEEGTWSMQAQIKENWNSDTGKADYTLAGSMATFKISYGIHDINGNAVTKADAVTLYESAKQAKEDAVTAKESAESARDEAVAAKKSAEENIDNAISGHNENGYSHSDIRTAVRNAQTKANDAYSLAEGKSRAVSFDTVEDMISALKVAPRTEFKVGDNLFIKDVEVPDYWISAVLTSNIGIYGYYSISKLESDKVDFSQYQKKTDSSLLTIDKTVAGSINELKEKYEVHENDISDIVATLDTQEETQKEIKTNIEDINSKINIDLDVINKDLTSGTEIIIADTPETEIEPNDYNIILNHKRLYNGALYDEDDSALPTPSPTTPLEIVPTGSQAKIKVSNSDETISRYSNFTFIATNPTNQDLIENAITIGDYASEVKDNKVLIYTKKFKFNGTESWYLSSSDDNTNMFQFKFSSETVPSNRYIECLCNYFKYDNNIYNNDEECCATLLTTEGYYFRARVNKSFAPDMSSWKAKLAEWDTAGIPLTVYYVMSVPLQISIIANDPIQTISGGTVLSTEDIALTNAQAILDFTDYQISKTEKVYSRACDADGKTIVFYGQTNMDKDVNTGEYLSTLLNLKDSNGNIYKITVSTNGTLVLTKIN